MDNNFMNTNNSNENTTVGNAQTASSEAPVNAAPENPTPIETTPASNASNTSNASEAAQTAASGSAPSGSAPAVEFIPTGGAQNGNAQSNSGGTPDFSKYSGASSSFVNVPRETVYIGGDQQKQKKQKAPKGRVGAGTVAAIVAACMVFSGGAAFVGTYAANRVNGNQTTVSGGSSSASSRNPSVIFQSFGNTNKTAGTYEQVAAAVTPTVVEITTESVATDNSFWGGSYIVSGAGSGVIISSDGLIITNNHVVSGANTIKVKLSDGTEYEAKLIGTDSDSDIAVIRIEATNLPCALIGDSGALNVGQEVVAVGNPLGEFGGSVTNGIVSGLSRDVTIGGTDMNLIQTNAAVNPGNSGGGLFNLYGELVGIVNAKSSSTSSGTSVEGIGFAIPIDKAVNVATELVNYGYVRGKVMLGISYVDVTSSWDAMRYGVNSLGVYVVSSEFEENDLRSGDRIVAVDDKEVEFSSDIKSALKDHKVGDVITVKVVRSGKYYDVKVTLHEYIPATATDSTSSFAEKASGSDAKG